MPSCLIASFLACVHRWRRGVVLQGYLVLISTHMSEIGEEQFSGRFFKEGMTDVSYSPELRQAVAAGPTSIKVSTLPRALKTHDVVRYFKCLDQPGKPTQRTCRHGCSVLLPKGATMFPMMHE